MNDGANIVKLGAVDLRRTHGDVLTTSQANRTELSRRYLIHKHLKYLGFQLLMRGYKAPEYSNLYLLDTPRRTTDATYAYFDCVFSGILDISEGGNGPLYEKFDRTSNIAAISSTVSYTQPVYRYFYTIRKDSDDRSGTRVIPLPPTVVARNTAGEKIIYDGSRFFWELFDIPRSNFDLYDEVIESWKLTFIS
jgi:hypothetical protein